MSAITAETATVYKGARRRFLTERAAYLDVARDMWKQRHRRLGHHNDGEKMWDDPYCEGCDLQCDETAKVIARLARWLRWRDGRLREVATWLRLFGFVVALRDVQRPANATYTLRFVEALGLIRAAKNRRAR